MTYDIHGKVKSFQKQTTLVKVLIREYVKRTHARKCHEYSYGFSIHP